MQPNRHLCTLILLFLSLVCCARIVTETTDGGQLADEVSGADISQPDCPAGAQALNGLCHQSEQGNCGWYLPGAGAGGEMCRILHGTYFIGCDTGMDCPGNCDGHCPGCPEESQPRTGITLDEDIFIDRYEVTNFRYREYLTANSDVSTPTCDDEDDLWDPKERDVDADLLDHPVVCVTVEDAEKFCTWEGKALPRETEWEVGARGQAGNIYPWGDCFDTEAAQCLHEIKVGQGEDDWKYDPLYNCMNIYDSVAYEDTVPVADNDEPFIKKDCVWGLSHMAGNAAEWVADRWTADHGPGDGCVAQTHFCRPEGDDQRVLRGGSYRKKGEDITGWAREEAAPGLRKRHIGFRCAWRQEEER